MWEWIISNKEWLLSGIGVTVIVAIIGIIKAIFKRKKTGDSKIILQQENTNNSSGVQIGVQNNYGGKGNE